MDSERLDDLGPLEPPAGVPLEGPMRHRGYELWRSEDGVTEVGVWEVDPGLMRANFENEGEFVHVLSGEMICIPDEGAETRLGPGDSMVFPAGWQGRWRIESTMRKVYVSLPARGHA